MKIRMTMFTLIILLSVFFSACRSSATISNMGLITVWRNANINIYHTNHNHKYKLPRRTRMGKSTILPSLQLGHDQNVVYLSNSMDGGNSSIGRQFILPQTLRCD